MRRAAAAVATAVLTTSVLLGSTPVSAAPAEDPIVWASVCGPLGGAVCEVDPVESLVAELQHLAEEQVAPAPAPAQEGSPAPAPAQEGSPAPAGPPSPGTISASSAPGPTSFGDDLSAAEASSSGGASGPSVPIVQVGGTLDLGPLALPSFTTNSATSAHELAREAAVIELVGLAVAEALAPDDRDSSRTTAVIMALCMLMLAGGLLLDERRRARVPIRL